MSYGHRRDPAGYTDALNAFDKWLGGFLENMRADDVLIITADHGCDPCHSGTDHTREYIPALICGEEIKCGANLGTRSGFCDLGQTIAELLGVSGTTDGTSFANEFLR